MYMPAGSVPPAINGMEAYMRGMGCGGSCHCGGTCKDGMGAFDSGLDVTGWSFTDWLMAGAAAAGAWALTNKAKRTVRSKRAIRRLKKAM